jgi:hypothetical protein
MADTHSKIMKAVQLDWTKENRGRLFPNQVGQLWLPARKEKITYGLKTGSSDLIGWETWCEGQAIFACVEVKTLASPIIKKAQILWLNAISVAGGRAYVAMGVDKNKGTYSLDELAKGYTLTEWEIREG